MEERDGGSSSLARRRPIIFRTASRDPERSRRTVPRPLVKVCRVNGVERTRSALQTAAKKKHFYLLHRRVRG